MQNDKKLMYKLIKPYVCPKCGQEMLMFTTERNTIIDYKQYLNCAYSLSEMKSDLLKRKINGIKCIRCGDVKMIDWSNGWPIVLENKILMEFGVI